MATRSTTTTSVTIKAPRFETAEFNIKGDHLVVHRFSTKVLQGLEDKAKSGKAAGSKKTRDPKDFDAAFNEARYISREGWDGFHAAAIRNALISACRLVGFKMTLAKMSIFVLQDGWDATEPQIPLVRIYGTPTKQRDMARVETGQPYVCVRAAYHDWSAKVRIRWDADQFSLEDVTNLMVRVGQQVGLCEGRPDSKNSAGMGWGTFTLEQTDEGNDSKGTAADRAA